MILVQALLGAQIKVTSKEFHAANENPLMQIEKICIYCGRYFQQKGGKHCEIITRGKKS